MRIGELARRSGISRDAIRLYERQGLIRSGIEGRNGYRAYGDDALMTLDVVREAQAAGLSLADLTVFIGQLAGLAPAKDGIEFLEAKIREVRQRIEKAQKFLDMLTQTRIALERAARGDRNDAG